MTMYSKKQGEIVETTLQLELQKRGYIVSKPVGDSDSYDLVCDYCGLLHRIQIKSTGKIENSGRGNRYRINATRGSKYKIAYDKSEADILAFYIIPLDIWYIIPIAALRGLKTVSLYPHRNDKESEFDKYRNRWDLLK